jgi:hypothetical protein
LHTPFGYTLKKESRPEPVSHAIHNVNKQYETILTNLSAHAKVGSEASFYIESFVSGNENFRMDISADYKGGREDEEKPFHLSDCKQHIVNKWNGSLEEGLEADDLLGIAAMNHWRMCKRIKDYPSCIIVTTDKDLNCVPGWHYNYVKDELFFISDEAALRFFYTQVLMGDRTDGVVGIPGVGKATATKRIATVELCEDAWDLNKLELLLYRECRRMYIAYAKTQWKKEHPERTLDLKVAKEIYKRAMADLEMNAKLLWILQEPFALWSPPIKRKDDALESKGKRSKEESTEEAKA